MEVPFGFCHCGCEQKTTVFSKTSQRDGAIKGQPAKYLRGHVVAHPRPAIIQPEDQSIRLIALTQGQVATVDVGDYGWLNKFRWYARLDKNGNYYACRDVRFKGTLISIGMHVAIVQPRPGFIADHINGNTLDYRRYNLREATYAQNGQNRGLLSTNTTGVPGVSWTASKGKYGVTIYVDGKNRHKGYFSDLEKAAKVREAAEIEHFGEFRRKRVIEAVVTKE